MAIKIKDVKERVKTVLTEREDSRDCDQKLFALILYRELMEKSKSDAGLNPKILIAETLLKIMSMNEMTNFESVRRARALLQSCPKDCTCKIEKKECKAQKYRGKKWKERKGYESHVKNDVINFKAECEHIWIPILDENNSHHCRLCKKNKKR
jgi:hypothetical protein